MRSSGVYRSEPNLKDDSDVIEDAGLEPTVDEHGPYTRRTARDGTRCVHAPATWICSRTDE